MLASLLLLAGQASPLSNPSFDKPITLSAKGVLVPKLLTELNAATGVSIRGSSDLQQLKVTIFAKDRPVREVMEAIANTLDASWIGTTSSLSLVPEAESDRRKFLEAEDQLMIAEGNRRLELLASLTKTEPAPTAPEEEGEPFGTPAPPFAQYSPLDWSTRAIKDPLLYAVGLWARKPSYLEAARSPRFFRVKAPVSTHESRHNLCAIDEASKPLENLYIAFRYLNESGELQVVPVGREAYPTTPLSSMPFRFAEPPTLLREMPFAKRLLAWVNEVPQSVAERQLSGTRAIETPYFSGKHGIAEYLHDLHNRTGMTIVADDFRVAARGLSPHAPTTVAAAVAELRTRERCFVRYADGVLRVRHPAYWRLRRSEPPEQVLADFEAKAQKQPPDLADYAGLAAKLRDAYPFAMERFLLPERTLTRFNSMPLVESFPALASLGLFSRSEFDGLVSGGPFRFEVGKGRSDAWYITGAIRQSVFYQHVLNPRMQAVLEANYTPVRQHLELTNRFDEFWKNLGDGTDPGDRVWLEFATTNIPKANFGFGPQACVTYPITIPAR